MFKPTFRVWDPDRHEMLYRGNYSISPSGHLLDGHGSAASSKLILMTSAEIPCTNANVVYEGDILKYHIDRYRTVIGVVGWGEDRGRMVGCGFTIMAINRPDDYHTAEELIGRQWAGLAQPKLIGNIYENPELLLDKDIIRL